MRTARSVTAEIPMTNLRKTGLLLVVGVPFLAVLAAAWQAWNRWVNLQDLLLLVFFFFLMGLSVTVGLHRYFTHKSFTASRGLELALAVMALLALEGPIIRWVASHRMHHQFSDEEEDLHSPLDGLWHAHVGWIFGPRHGNPSLYAKDLLADRTIVTLDKLVPLWLVISLGVPFLIGGWQGLLWGGLVRTFLVHHFTWSINSVCHAFGSRPYQTRGRDQSRNVNWLALFTFGESYHCTHHAFPTSARHADHWWQDLSYCVIRGFALLGLASDIKVPTLQQFARKRIPSGIAESH